MTYVIVSKDSSLKSKAKRIKGIEEVIYLAGSIQDCLYLAVRLELALKFETKELAQAELNARELAAGKGTRFEIPLYLEIIELKDKEV